MTGKGFYAILFLCVAAICVSGYMLLSSGRGGGDSVSDYSLEGLLDGQSDTFSYPDALEALDRAVTPVLPSTPTPNSYDDESVPVAAMTSIPDPGAADAPAPGANVSDASPTSTPSSASTPKPTPSPTPKPKAAMYVWPVKGETVNAFSDSELAYNKTMGDWRVHLGMDIAAGMGDQVVAVSDGKVTEVYDDVFWGATVTIDHGDGLTSRYSNLMKKPAVSVGDSVTAGQIIGGVGATAEAERREVSHLHFSMEKDKKPIDPMEYLPK